MRFSFGSMPLLATSSVVARRPESGAAARLIFVDVSMIVRAWSMKPASVPISSTFGLMTATERSIDRAASSVPVRNITESSAHAIRIVSTTGDMPRAPLRMSRNMADSAQHLLVPARALRAVTAVDLQMLVKWL